MRKILWGKFSYSVPQTIFFQNFPIHLNEIYQDPEQEKQALLPQRSDIDVYISSSWYISIDE